MRTTKIEWTERTWNPITGCSKLSAGCVHCYAETMANRLKAMGVAKYSDGFSPVVHEECLNEPYSWKKPQIIFVCSMADIFHESIPFDFVNKVFDTMKNTPQHCYQVLTKRTVRMAEYFSHANIPSNVWMGVTVENDEAKGRIDTLKRIDAPIRFLSCEPLVGDLGQLDLSGIDWIIVGGESGAQARPMKPEWARSIRDQALSYSIPFFFKQWGAWGEDGIKRNKKANGKELDGEIFQMMPSLGTRF